jgi:hypothetical protein
MKIQPVCELFPLLLASCVGWLPLASAFGGTDERHVSLIADSSDLRTSTHKEINATADDRIPVKLSPRGGFAAKITLYPPVP